MRPDLGGLRGNWSARVRRFAIGSQQQPKVHTHQLAYTMDTKLTSSNALGDVPVSSVSEKSVCGQQAKIATTVLSCIGTGFVKCFANPGSQTTKAIRQQILLLAYVALY